MLNTVVVDGFPPTIAPQVALDRSITGEFVTGCTSVALVPTPQYATERLDCLLSPNGAGVDLLVALSTTAVSSQSWTYYQPGAIFFQAPVISSLSIYTGPVDGGQVCSC